MQLGGTYESTYFLTTAGRTRLYIRLSPEAPPRPARAALAFVLIWRGGGGGGSGREILPGAPSSYCLGPTPARFTYSLLHSLAANRL